MKGRLENTLKKLIQINTVCNTSTGKIMLSIQRKAKESGYITLSCVGRRAVCQDMPCKRFGGFFAFWWHVAVNAIFDRQGYGSYFATQRLIRCIRKEKPDIIHLHNLHGYYLYLPILFRYLTDEFEGKIFWTFHDCWPFTGHCAYFTAAGCNKWQEGCFRCPNKTQYPISLLLDASSINYQAKRKMFGNLKNLTIIVPSEWMRSLVEHSFMKHYPVEVVNNGINLDKFHYTVDGRVLQKYHISREKKVLLGVANVWDKRKGMKDFLELSQSIPEEYQIVLVGLSKAQIRGLPHGIVGVERTDSVEELAAIYSHAHIFINPSREESFSLVTIEAMACGTPVIALGTSAVKELICDENGVVIENNSVRDYLYAIRKIEERQLSRASVRMTTEKYNDRDMVDKILKLYEKVL